MTDEKDSKIRKILEEDRSWIDGSSVEKILAVLDGRELPLEKKIVKIRLSDGQTISGELIE